MGDTPKSTDAATRRDFLKLAATSVPAAAVAVATARPAQAVEQPKTALGLRKTEHVKKYLDSARF